MEPSEEITQPDEHAAENPMPIGIVIFLSVGGLIVLAAIIMILITPVLARKNRDIAEQYAKATLLELASAQVSYQENHKFGHYGLYGELQAEGFIDSKVSHLDLIDRFDVEVLVGKRTSEVSGLGSTRNTFTIIARPEYSRSEMSQFGIREDGIVRRHIPGRNDSNDVTTWTPINDTSELPDVSLNPLN